MRIVATDRRRWLGAAIGLALLLMGAGAPWLTVNQPSAQFSDFVLAPPMWPRIIDAEGRPRVPFIYPLRLEDRLSGTYTFDRTRPVALHLLRSGAFIAPDPTAGVTWFPLGTDALGRDQLSRLAWGARLSLGVALTAACGTLLIGAAVGSLAGFMGGLLDDGLMRVSDFIIALPAVYAVLALRAALPLVLTTPQVFGTMVVVLALVGWPLPARGVRAVISAERSREYAEAARAAGASRTRLLLRHLLPAAHGFLAVQTTLLVPAFVLAEATLSYVGLGFAEPNPSWGAMLRDAGRGRALFDAPWLLAPAGAIVLAALSVTLLAGESAREIPLLRSESREV